MAGIIYNRDNSGIGDAYGSNAQLGKLLTPLKILIEHESDVLSRKDGVMKRLFNVEKSDKFGETIVNMDEFGEFEAVAEGQAAKDDTMGETGKKFIEHIQFIKEFAITANMMEDAKIGVAAEARRRAQNFIRAYYRTMNSICEKALINGTSTAFTFNGQSVDVSTADGKALFSNAHDYGKTSRRGGTNNSNYFHKSNLLQNASAVENALGDLAVKLRNIKDENGEPLGYTADTVIIPGNQPALEAAVKKVLGTQQVTGSGNNDINLQYGNMTLVILPHWATADKRIMVMSSEANQNLSGNMFFNRIPLTITNWIDHHTGNYIWNGRCRFGVGFGSYKHILLAVDGAAGGDEITG